MRITHEADYAIRIVSYLSRHDGIIGAKQIALKCGVSLKFTLKILRKLAGDNIVTSHKGVYGGYEIIAQKHELSFGRIIEAIDGPIEINHCLGCDFECTRVNDKENCTIRKKFLSVNTSLKDELYKQLIDEY